MKILTGIRVIRVFNKVEAEQERFNQASLEVSRIATMANRLMGALMPLMMLILNFINYCCYLVWWNSN